MYIWQHPWSLSHKSLNCKSCSFIFHCQMWATVDDLGIVISNCFLDSLIQFHVKEEAAGSLSARGEKFHKKLSIYKRSSIIIKQGNNSTNPFL